MSGLRGDGPRPHWAGGYVDSTAVEILDCSDHGHPGDTIGFEPVKLTVPGDDGWSADEVMNVFDAAGLVPEVGECTVRFGLPGKLQLMEEVPAEEWSADKCVFCLEHATTMVVLEDHRHAVMMCQECIDDDGALLDDVEPQRIMLLVVASLN